MALETRPSTNDLLEEDDLGFTLEAEPDLEAYTRLLNEEVKQRDNFDEQFKSLGRYYNGPHPLIKCYNCNEFGHMSNGCPQPSSRVRCVYCGEVGHTAFNCNQVICFRCKGVTRR
mmetsp:Transcript_551/g.767  ORF Transcript_551/g.767 Transcript_551/m.767 type:complete len:115 (+) Transcript_551:5623-5967(+)